LNLTLIFLGQYGAFNYYYFITYTINTGEAEEGFGFSVSVETDTGMIRLPVLKKTPA